MDSAGASGGLPPYQPEAALQDADFVVRLSAADWRLQTLHRDRF